ncbi:MAG: transposase, partial [Burkholderiales bacterium]|nr:transposase [Burkholderiales bacterium]
MPRCGCKRTTASGCSSCAATSPRPALSDQRVQLNAAGQVEFELETPWRDGTTHLVMSPLEFMQRLAATATQGRPSGTRAAAAVVPHQIWCPHSFAARSERTPASRTRRAGTQRQASRAGGAAGTA